MLGEKYGRQKILAITIVIMLIQYVLYWLNTVLRHDWYLGTDSAVDL
ncbi:hypothetical protein ACLBR5_00175 [Escherichia coli]